MDREEVPVEKVAAELGVSRQTVYQRQRIALPQLRGVLSPTVAAGAL
jgi:DNA-directed RNA polymerase specialized sigma subunit